MTKGLALALAAAVVLSLKPADSAMASSGDGIEKRTEKVSSEIQDYVRRTGDQSVTVIMQLNGVPTPQLNSLLARRPPPSPP